MRPEAWKCIKVEKTDRVWREVEILEWEPSQRVKIVTKKKGDSYFGSNTKEGNIQTHSKSEHKCEERQELFTSIKRMTAFGKDQLHHW